MSAESVGSVSTMNRGNNLSNNAQSSITKAGKRAGFTGKKLAIFVAVITSTLIAMTAPTLASGIQVQRAKLARNAKRAGYLSNLEDMKLNLQQRNAMTELRELALSTNKRANAVTFKELNQALEKNKITKNMASKAARSNAFRQVLNLPVRSVSVTTGVAENFLNIIAKYGTNVKRTAAATTETIAKGAENVGETTRVITGGMKNTAKFLGPYAFVLTMIVMMAGISLTSASIIKQITSMLSGMMSKGIPITKNVVVKVFNMMYSTPEAKPTPPSNRVKNVTNNAVNRRSPRNVSID